MLHADIILPFGTGLFLGQCSVVSHFPDQLVSAFLTTVILFLPSQFFIIAIFSVCGILYNLNVLFSSSQFFLFIVFVFHVPIECGLFHHGYAYFGNCTFCFYCGHGLDCHSSCFGYCFAMYSLEFVCSLPSLLLCLIAFVV